MTTDRNRENQTIECMRIICCVSILFIHCGFPLPSPVRSYAMAIARFAVPFLILLSGWFADHNEGWQKAKKKRWDTLRVILIGGIICLLWNCLNSYLQYSSLSAWLRPHLNRKTLYHFLLFNRAVFFNSVFYYFFIMVYVYSIFILAQRWKITAFLCYLSPVLLATGIYICEFAELPWYYGGNFLFLGLPVFLLGYRLREVQQKLIKWKEKEWLCILAAAAITITERMLFGSRYLYFGAVLLAVSVFVFCINHETLKCPKLLVKAGTMLSLPMIVIHCEVRDTLQLLTKLNNYALPLLVLVISLLLSVVYQKKIRRRISVS